MNDKLTILEGDCRETLKTLADESIDSCVTDPPYELGFMGKKWDSSGVAFDVAAWREVFRVLKPGAHMLAFGGTRTYHRMACAIEDAGFEIRDQMAWVYGSGFPKSLDVSKAIDKHGPSGQVPFAEFAAHYELQRKSKGLTHAQVCAVGGWHGDVNHGGSSVNWANGYGMPTVEQWAILQPLLGLGDKWKVRVEREQYEREVVGKRAVRAGVAFTSDGPTELNVTIPKSDAAKQWDGWGTALKPAWEPICVARKPLVGTVAANVLQHGTGALNIDKCRVEIDPNADASQLRSMNRSKRESEDGWGMSTVNGDVSQVVRPDGRWPANLIHDGSEEVVALFPETTSGTFNGKRSADKFRNAYSTFKGTPEGEGSYEGNTGSAARFFYCAKVSPSERGDSDHPTMKPLALMRYLVRLVTPPGGTTLDPFGGSGSTAVAALHQGFSIVVSELNPEYIPLIHERCNELLLFQPVPDLFSMAGIKT